MSDFIMIKGINPPMKDSIIGTLNFIRSKIAKKRLVDALPDFETWYHSMALTVQAHDLYRVMDVTDQYLEQQTAKALNFQQEFSIKFKESHNRSSIANVRNAFNNSIIEQYNLYLGDVDTLKQIDSIFIHFRKYAEFIVNLYQDIYSNLVEHIEKEQTEVNQFFEVTRLVGNVSYVPNIGGAFVYDLTFVKEYIQCINALNTIAMWQSLQHIETNITISDPSKESPIMYADLEYDEQIHVDMEAPVVGLVITYEDLIKE